MIEITNQDIQQAEGVQSTQINDVEEKISKLFRRQMELALSGGSTYQKLSSLTTRMRKLKAQCSIRPSEALTKAGLEEFASVLQETEEIFSSDGFNQVMRGENNDSQSEDIFPPGWDTINSEKRRTQARKDDTLNAQSQGDIERIADIATQLLSIKDSINEEHRQRFESCIRMLCRNCSERLSVLHRFFVMMTKSDSPDRGHSVSNYHRFCSIVSQRLSSDQRIAEIQRIATTEIETSTTSTTLVQTALQDMRRAMDHVDRLADKLKLMPLENVVHERDLLIREELSRAYANLAKSGLGKTEALMQC